MFLKFEHIERFETLEDRVIEHIAEANTVIATEKIDGSHITIWIPLEADGEIKVYTRNGNLLGGFGDYEQNCKEKLLKCCEKIRFFVHDTTINFDGITLDGEIFGKRILNRIPYQETCDFVIYRCSLVNGDSVVKTLDFDRLNYILDECSESLHKIREVKRFTFDESHPLNWQDLIDNLPLPFDSAYTITPHLAEGYVVYFYKDGEWLGCFKRKDSSFDDRKSKSNKIESNVDPELKAYTVELNREFAEYAINDNRILDAYSKGYMRIDKLVAFVISDAKEDFLKTHDLSRISFDKNLTKNVFNVGSAVFLKAKEILKNLEANKTA